MYDGHVRIIIASSGNVQESRRFAFGIRDCHSHFIVCRKASVERLGG